MDRHPSLPAPPSGRSAWVLALFVLAFDFADQGLAGPLLNPLLRDFFGRTANVVPLGWVTFAATALSAVSMILSGWLAGRRSRTRTAAAGAFLYAAASLLTALTPHGRPGYTIFLALRAANGVGIGLVIPAVFALAGDVVRPARRASAFGIMSLAMIVGRLAGFAAGGALQDSWRTAYLLSGAVNLLLAAGLVFTREPVRGAGEDELGGVLAEGAEYRYRVRPSDLKLLWNARSNFWLIANFVDALPGSIILFLIFKYMEEVHAVGAAAVDAVLVVVVAAGALGAVVFGRLGDRGFRRDKRARVWTALACNALPIGFMILFLSSRVRVAPGANVAATLASPGLAGLVLTVAAAMFINQGVNPNWYASLTDVNLPEHRAAMISTASVVDLAGNALGPLIASYLATARDVRTAMASVVVFWALNVVLWLPILAHIRGDIARVHSVLAGRAEDMNRSLAPHGR
jgi:MFS family permease